MSQVNLGGLAGAAIGGLVGYGVGKFLGGQRSAPLDSWAWGAYAGCLSASMFGLLYDRSVVPEFRKSYKVLTRHITRQERSGPDYDPRERLALFGIPVAFATFILPIVTAVAWIVAWNTSRQGVDVKLQPRWLAIYLAAGVVGATLTMIVGLKTTDHRLLERQIAFNTEPRLETAPAPAVDAAPAGPPTAEELGQLRTRGRRDAVFVIVLGALLLAVHHYFAMHDGRYYPKVAFGGPMIIAVGIFGLFEPLIMTRHLPVGKYYPKMILLLTLIAIGIGAVGGWQLDSWYHG